MKKQYDGYGYDTISPIMLSFSNQLVLNSPGANALLVARAD
jgi:hypothetical protein